jgi:hypothetical protein
MFWRAVVGVQVFCTRNGQRVFHVRIYMPNAGLRVAEELVAAMLIVGE